MHGEYAVGLLDDKKNRKPPVLRDPERLSNEVTGVTDESWLNS